MITNLPSIESVIQDLRGRKGLRTAKPMGIEKGFSAYVWRWVRFHSNIDPTMPTMCDFDLKDWIESHVDIFGPKIKYQHDQKHPDYESSIEYYQIIDKECRRISNIVEKQYINPICAHYNLDSFAGARRWGRALGYC